MRVAILSMFSTSTGYIDRYFEQAEGLHRLLKDQGGDLRLYLAEGDSTDETYAQLKDRIDSFSGKGRLIQHHHGQPLRRGTAHPERLANLSIIWQKLFALVPKLVTHVIIVESDLVWEPETLLALLEHTDDGNVHCPMIWLGDLFYDIFAYRRGGQRFTNQPPYHPDLEIGEPLELDSAGSCLAMPADVLRAHRDEDMLELVGFCENVRAGGAKVILHSDLNIEQPKSEWVWPGRE